MTDFMTALPVILVQLTCPGDQRALTCNLCRESHKTQLWLCFLVLSFLSPSTCSAYEDLQNCLDKVKPTIKKSDAMLYAPSTNDIEENCKMMTLNCYMLELLMVLDEENIVGDKVDCIIEFKEKLSNEDNPVGCPPCEAYSLRNITVFLDRLNHFLEERNALSRGSTDH